MEKVVEVRAFQVFARDDLLGWAVGLYGPSGVDGGYSYLHPALTLPGDEMAVFATPEEALAVWRTAAPAEVTKELVRAAAPMAIVHIKRNVLYRRMTT